ncbi:PREDICTED: uncharacterized protein C12orf73 homolog [Fulmarus glacialis]|uniref:uncharacterized protein C12orf73 homolog n=1 Tax=Fulmarus glacialis TaxID=30455 RepID=UPI00051B642E|nr:PREDICTED: uncharacterized protein C12orf73 homolog [Fulmarus glacialis]
MEGLLWRLSVRRASGLTAGDEEAAARGPGRLLGAAFRLAAWYRQWERLPGFFRRGFTLWESIPEIPPKPGELKTELLGLKARSSKVQNSQQ